MRMLMAAVLALLVAAAVQAQPKDPVAVTAGVWAKASGQKPKAQAVAESQPERGYPACVKAVQDGRTVFLCIGQYVTATTDYFTPTLKKDGVDEWYDYGRYKCYKDVSGKPVMEPVDKDGNRIIVYATAPVTTQAATPDVSSYPVGFSTPAPVPFQTFRQPYYGGTFGGGTVFTSGGCPGGTCPTTTIRTR